MFNPVSGDVVTFNVNFVGVGHPVRMIYLLVLKKRDSLIKVNEAPNKEESGNVIALINNPSMNN